MPCTALSPLWLLRRTVLGSAQRLTLPLLLWWAAIRYYLFLRVSTARWYTNTIDMQLQWTSYNLPLIVHSNDTMLYLSLGVAIFALLYDVSFVQLCLRFPYISQWYLELVVFLISASSARMLLSFTAVMQFTPKYAKPLCEAVWPSWNWYCHRNGERGKFPSTFPGPH